jgi:hypothetical protein
MVREAVLVEVKEREFGEVEVVAARRLGVDRHVLGIGG